MNIDWTKLNRMKEYKIYVDDVLHYLHTTDDRFRFALSDPPYEINHLGGWDSSGITYNPDLYSGLMRVLLPGAFLVFYSHARTHHRVMAAMEDAGFILHKAIFAWVYTSGNPMGAPNIQRQVDNHYAKHFGGICKCENPEREERNVWEDNKYPIEWYVNTDLKTSAFPVFICRNCGKPIREIIQEVAWGKTSGMKNIGGGGYGNGNTQIIAKSMTPQAEALKPYTYGMMAFKPMLEPIIIAQKPYDTHLAVEGILKYGTGIVNVHEARSTSRWPGNFIAIHDLGCERNEDGSWNCIDECAIKEFVDSDPEFTEKIPTFAYHETDYSLASIDRFLYDSKPNKSERNKGLSAPNNHPSLKPISVNEYLARLFLPPTVTGVNQALNLFNGSGSESIGLLIGGWDIVVGVEMNPDYAEMAMDRVAIHVREPVNTYYENLNDHKKM